jgi:hypothetical protein
MKKLLGTAFFLPLALVSISQDATVQNLKNEASKTITKDPADTSSKTWNTGGLTSINVSQGALSNWAAGGDKFSLSVNVYSNLHAYYKKGRHSWDNNLDINLGYVNTTSLGARKNDDRIDLLSKYGYALNSKLNLSGLFNFRSQFFDGFTYPDDTTKLFASTAFAPAYILVSPGLDFKPLSNLSLFVSPITSRWVIVSNSILNSQGLYGVEPGKSSLNELGAYASVNYFTDASKPVSYKGRLDVFSNYKNNPQNIDVFMTNVLAFKISKVLSATWSLDIIYDDDVRLFGKNLNAPGTQFKSLFGIGFLLKY